MAPVLAITFLRFRLTQCKGLSLLKRSRRDNSRFRYLETNEYEHDTLRGEALIGGALVGEVIMDGTLRGGALTHEALRGGALYGEALRGEQLTGAALRGVALRGEVLRGGEYKKT